MRKLSGIDLFRDRNPKGWAQVWSAFTRSSWHFATANSKSVFDIDLFQDTVRFCAGGSGHQVVLAGVGEAPA